MTIFSETEWGKLKKIVVGDATHANFPANDPDFYNSMAGDKDNRTWTETEFEFGPVRQSIIDRANESLNKFSSVLEDLGAEVYRPLPRNYQQLGQFYGYCPRDTVLVVGDKVLACPTPWQSLLKEWE